MIEELVIYVNEWHAENQLDDTVSLEQARILGQFGASYEVQDAKYWKLVTEMLEISLAKTSDFSIVANVATMMKHQEILSNKVMQIIASFIEKANNMDSDELSHLTAMILSDEMRQAVDVKKVLPRLEDALISNLKHMTVDNYSLICYALTEGQENQHTTLTMDKLLESGADTVLEWLAAEKIKDENNLVNIAAAYHLRQGEVNVPPKYAELMETVVLKRS